MKKLLLLLGLTLFLFSQSYAQNEPTVSDTLDGWEYGWVAGLNGSQASYSNWSQGGSNNISASGKSNLTALFREDRFSYSFTLDTRYGQSKIQGEGTRKTDDLLSIRNRFLYDIGDENSDFSLFGNLNFRTQFDEGYDFGAGPNGEDVLISDFLAPAYISENVGLAYSPGDHFSFEAGVGMRQTIVKDEELAPLYGLDEGTQFRNEAGINLGADYNQEFASNLILKSRVETFTNVNRALSSTDVYFSNEVTGKINDLLNASVRVDLVYDDDFSKELQVMQVISVGISFILI
ncbi:MAG: DUF3078 domain-containing protein [Balneolaceae bacterium]